MNKQTNNLSNQIKFKCQKMKYIPRMRVFPVLLVVSMHLILAVDIPIANAGRNGQKASSPLISGSSGVKSGQCIARRTRSRTTLPSAGKYQIKFANACQKAGLAFNQGIQLADKKMKTLCDEFGSCLSFDTSVENEDIVQLISYLERIRIEQPSIFNTPWDLTSSEALSPAKNKTAPGLSYEERVNILFEAVGLLDTAHFDLEKDIEKEIEGKVSCDCHDFHDVTHLIDTWSRYPYARKKPQQAMQKILQWLEVWPAAEWVKYSPYTLINTFSRLRVYSERKKHGAVSDNDAWLESALSSILDETLKATVRSLITGALPPEEKPDTFTDQQLERKDSALQAAILTGGKLSLPYLCLIDLKVRRGRFEEAKEIYDQYEECIRPYDVGDGENSLKYKLKRQFISTLVELFARQYKSSDGSYIKPEKSFLPYAPDEFLFSPTLSPGDWQNQLRMLQSYDATIRGVDVNEFTSVVLVRLDDISPNEMGGLTGRSPEQLVVVYGKCLRKNHLAISKGITVIGPNAEVTANGRTSRLAAPTAKIVAEKNSMNFVNDEWNIGGRDKETKADVIKTAANLYKAGAYPLVYLNGSRLIGVELYCEDVTQGVVGSEGSLLVANVFVHDSARTGVVFHDYQEAAITDVFFDDRV